MNTKILMIIVAFALVGCSAKNKTDSAATSVNTAEETSNLRKDELHAILIGRYQVIAAGWFINKNCAFLSEEQSALQEKHVGRLNVYAQHNGLAQTKHLLQMQKTAQYGSTLPKYSSCGVEARKLVEDTHRLATMLYDDLVAK